MCGHVGIAGKLVTKDENTMKRLLMLDYFRGTDSTGFVGIKSAGDVKLAKIASHPLDLFDMQRFKDALNGNASTVFMGHNRAATRGVVNSYNAHPFAIGNIVGAHNGTLSAHTTKLLEDALEETMSVDSMALIAHIDRFGIDNTIKKLRSSDNGVCPDAWALVWYNIEEKTLNFIRNKERPMWYAYNEAFTKVFWASEWPMIDAAVSLTTGADKMFRTETGYRFFEMDEDIHYKFEIEELKKGSDTRPKPMAKKICGEGTGPAAKGSAYDPFQRNYHETHYQGTKTGAQTTHGSPRTACTDLADKTNVIHLFADKTDPYGGIITKERFEAISKDGCCWCSSTIEYEDVGCTIIDRDDIILCPECSSTSNSNTNRVYLKDLMEAM